MSRPRENARPYEEYATVMAILGQRTEKAILLSRDDWAASVWVPKRCLSFQSRVPVENAALKSEIEIRVELSFALKNRLV